jgi:hypothetical protein
MWTDRYLIFKTRAEDHVCLEDQKAIHPLQAMGRFNNDSTHTTNEADVRGILDDILLLVLAFSSCDVF